MVTTARRGALSTFSHSDRVMRSSAADDSELSGVDKFCFLQPKDRKRTTKEWWKSQKADFAEKTLKVTQLQVSQPFPACVARQEVVHRIVYSQSPLEAGVDAICQWCAVLFRTAVATAGQRALGENADPGIGTDAAKVVADCIHSSNVKEMGLALLQKSSDFSEGDNSTEFSLDYDHLTEDEIKKLRSKIARLLIVFIELLHLLISRNRDLLLDVIQERKKEKGSSSDTLPPHYYPPPPPSAPAYIRTHSLGDANDRPAYNYGGSRDATRREASPQHNTGTQSLREGRGRETPTSQAGDRSVRRQPSDGLRHVSMSQLGPQQQQQQQQQRHQRGRSSDADSVVSASNRTDSAIAVQSELQRAFINLCKSLYPRVQGTMQDETPRWLKQCSQDNYFSLGTYRLTKIPIAEELCFNASDVQSEAGVSNYMSMHMLGSQNGGGGGVPSEIDSPRSFGGAGGGHVRGGSTSAQSIVSRGSTDNNQDTGTGRFGSRGSDRFSFLNQI